MAQVALYAIHCLLLRETYYDFFFLKFVINYLFFERQKKQAPICWLILTKPAMAKDRSEPGSRNSILVYHVGGRNPVT